MARLSKEAHEFLKNDLQLVGEVGQLMGLKINSISNTINRNAKTLAQWNVVELIARKMGKNPADILMQESAEMVA